MIKAILLSLLLVSCNFAHATCEPVRDKCGNIKRSAYQAKKFRLANPCPVTGLTTGACVGYEIDHIVPLSCCGMDRPENMQWLTIEEHDAKTLVDNRVCRK